MYKSINRAIVEYLAENKRLVIPTLGAFIRRDSGEVVFVEFLKKDDGVLNSLLRSKLQLSQRVASDAIDEYVVEVSNTVLRDGGYVVDKLGTIRKDKDGIYELFYDIGVSVGGERTAAEPRRSNIEIGEERQQEQSPHITQTSRVVTSSHSPEKIAKEGGKAQPAEQKIAKEEPTRAHVTSSTEQRVKPHTTPKPQQRSAADDMHIRKRKRADLVMIIAIAAAIIALGVMVFGMMVNNDPMTIIEPTSPAVEQVEIVPEAEDRAN